MPPPVAGVGEPLREINGPNADETRSLLPSSTRGDDGELDPELDGDESFSFAPSVLGAVVWVLVFGGEFEPACFPAAGVN